MAFGDYSGSDKPNKGHEGGACNRQRCQAEPANWYNHGSFKWYCTDCAQDIGQDVVNKRDWERNYQPRLGHPMFETRAQMDTRRPVTAAPLAVSSDFLDYVPIAAVGEIIGDVVTGVADVAGDAIGGFLGGGGDFGGGGASGDW